jgi:Fe-S-cluster containining protein
MAKMKIEKDPERIKDLSHEKEEENWGFRSFLKSCEIPSKKIDSIVQRLYKEVSSQIDCLSCGNCCREISPTLKEKDITNMAEGLKISTEEFMKRYLKRTDEGSDYTFNKIPCHFLKSNTCSVYSFCPESCTSFPHLNNKNFVSRLISVIHNCSFCPIVFNVYEALKEEIWAMDDPDEFY